MITCWGLIESSVPWRLVLDTYPGGLCLLLEDLLHLHRQVLHQFQAINFLHSDCLKVFFVFLETNQIHSTVTDRQNIYKPNNNSACGGRQTGTHCSGVELTAHQAVTVFSVHLIRAE